MIDLLRTTLCKILDHAEHDDPRGAGWEQLHEAGLLTPFQQGLTSWSEAAELVRAAAERAAAIPFAEQVAASYLAGQLDVEIGGHLTTLADPTTSDLIVSAHGVTGRLALVPHAAVASQLWVEAHDEGRQRELVLVEMRGVEAQAGQNLAQEPRDNLIVTRAPSRARIRAHGPIGELMFLGALVRAVQMAALAEQVLASSLEHARTRVQFGRPIGSFQAVQQALAELGCEVAATNAGVDAACRALDTCRLLRIERAAAPIAAAKVQAGITARKAVEVGHAVHAAIGFTREHRLHRYTQRLLSYRAEFGAERVFAQFLGQRARESGPDALWSHLVAVSQPTPQSQ